MDLTEVLVVPWAIPIIMGCLVGIVAIVAGTISGCITSVAETKLKQSMVERGFSPADIERVVCSSSGETPQGAPREVKPAPYR